MRLSDGEKLILLMLSEVHQELGISSGVDAKLVQSAIYNDKTWAIPWEMGSITFEDTKTPGVVNNVIDTLEMWDILELSYEKLSPEDKSRVLTEAEPFGKEVKFGGFDVNNEGKHYGTARFLVDDMGRF